MPLNSLKTLATVLEHAQAERDRAAAAWRQAEAAARSAQGQADTLNTYRGEYEQRWTGRFQQEGSAQLLHCYQGFAGRLDQAITLQSQSAVQAAQRLNQARELLLEREQRVAAITKLIERRRRELAHMAARREQHQVDETAARLGRAAHLASPFN